MAATGTMAPDILTFTVTPGQKIMGGLEQPGQMYTVW
jgi:hypothetical protein